MSKDGWVAVPQPFGKLVLLIAFQRVPTVDVEIKASSVARAATLLHELNELCVGKAKDVGSRDSRRQRLRRSHLVGETTRDRAAL